MVTDQQVRRLYMLNQMEPLYIAAAKAGMNEKTARKYLRSKKLPSQVKQKHTWRTRQDPFEQDWETIHMLFNENPGLEAKTVFEHFQREYPGRYQDSQLRTLQRKIKQWRALEGPSKEIYFPQVHQPGKLCESDFTHMSDLAITIGRQRFDHLIYHFVLTYSNWEAGTICFSESYESLSEGLQNALWELGGVPKEHRTDCLTAAVKADKGKEFTSRYSGLLNYYGIEMKRIQPGHPNENGDVEQSHHRFKRALDQALMLRGSRDFESRREYESFLKDLFKQLNAGRRDKLFEEMKMMKTLPQNRLDDNKRLKVKVSPSSTIRVLGNVYSVHSRLINVKVDVLVKTEYLEIWYGQKLIETLPRIRGSHKNRIDYRHVISWLIRKPGAFENYKYQEDLYPSSRFRIVYDELVKRKGERANKEYLEILYLAATHSQAGVERALGLLMDQEKPINVEEIKQIIDSGQKIQPIQIQVKDIPLTVYDELLQEVKEAYGYGN